MRAGRFAPLGILLAVAVGLPASAVPMNGDLGFPLEGWGIVAHWHVGMGAISGRAGWLRKNFNDRGWPLARAGSKLPQAADGLWLRNAYRIRSMKWTELRMEIQDMPAGALLFINGAPLRLTVTADGVPIGKLSQRGINATAVWVPPQGETEAKVPAMRVVGVSPVTGNDVSLATLSSWRLSREKVERQIPEQWLKSADTLAWKVAAPYPPTTCDSWMPEGPVCLKAVIEVPPYWRKRPLTLFLHEIPGSPDVYLNGTLLVQGLVTPFKKVLGRQLKHNGRDTLCLVYQAPPSCVEAGADGKWGIAAIHWEESPQPPRLAPGIQVACAASGAATQEGMGRSLRYAAQLLALSYSGTGLAWTFSGGGKAEVLLVAAWPSTPFKAAESEQALGELAGWTGRTATGRSLWLVTPPTVGTSNRVSGNERLASLNRKMAGMAEENGMRVVPVFDVFRSALRRQRRWPARLELAGKDGILTGQGSYLLSLVILDAFSLP